MTIVKKDSTIEGLLVALVERHQADVLLYLKFMGCGLDQATDIAQELFLRVIEKIRDSGEPVTRSYLISGARYLYLNTIRADKHRTKREEANAAHEVWMEEIGERGSESVKSALRHCLDKLQEPERQIVRLRYGDTRADLSSVASALGMSISGTRKLLDRIKKALRKCIEHRMET